MEDRIRLLEERVKDIEDDIESMSVHLFLESLSAGRIRDLSPEEQKKLSVKTLEFINNIEQGGV